VLYQRVKAYSLDRRERVVAASDDGERVGEVADLLRVSVSYGSKAPTRRRRKRDHGAIAPWSPAADVGAALRGDPRSCCRRRDTTIEALRAWLLATHQMSASVGLIWHALKLLGLTLTKVDPSGRAGSAGRRLSACGMARDSACAGNRQADLHR
jgi:transposase